MEERVRKLARKRRQQLREAASALELAIAAPARTGSVWRDRVHRKLLDVRRALEDHIAEVDGPGGLAEQISEERPRLINPMGLLSAEHGDLREKVANILKIIGRMPAKLREADAAGVREAVMALIGQISRHRQKGADLVFDAYNVDIGGE